MIRIVGHGDVRYDSARQTLEGPTSSCRRLRVFSRDSQREGDSLAG